MEVFSRRVLAVSLLFVWVSTLANITLMRLPSPLDLLTTNRAYLLSRGIREATFLGVVLYLTILFVRPPYRLRIPINMVRLAAAIGAWVAACFFYSVASKGVPVSVAFLGLKFFQSAPFFLAGYVVAKRSKKKGLLKVSGLLRWYVGFLLLVTVAQVAMRFVDNRLLFVRYAGMFPNSNVFGAAIVSCSLWFICCEWMQGGEQVKKISYRPWLLLCVVLAMATGSRMAMTLTTVALLLSLSFRVTARTKKFFLAALPLLIVAVFVVVSQPGISRHRATTSNQRRAEIAGKVLENFETLPDVVFGYGIGLSSPKALIAGTAGVGAQTGNAHSAYLEMTTSFGVVGLGFFVSLFLISLSKGIRPVTDFFVFIVAMFCIGLNVWRLVPAGPLICLLWGQLFALGIERNLTLTEGIRRTR